jgi:hypothetical protein
MREPPPRVQMLGHPVVMVPVMGTGVLVLYQWTQNMDWTIPGLIAIAAMAVVGKASEHRKAFLSWRRAWDGFADTPPAPPQPPLKGKLAAAATIAALGFGYEAGALDGAIGPLVTLGLLAAIIVGGAMLVRRWLPSSRGARAASRSDAVTVCARSVMAVPTMTDAYGALPAHCWHVLNARSD